MDPDENDWVFTDAADDIDAGWILPDLVGYDPSRLMSGVFFPSSHRSAFTSFLSDSNPDLSVVPPSSSVISSSNGLILCRGSWSFYFICNPSTGARLALPKPPVPHRRDAPLVLISDASGFHVVCASDVSNQHSSHPLGVYTFDTFSSATCKWRSSAAIFLPGRLVPSSGISCGGVAYWRTAPLDSPAVVVYDPAADAAKVLPLPTDCYTAGDRWQIGETGGGLGCVCVRETDVVIYALASGSSSSRWTICDYFGFTVREDAEEWDGKVPIVCRQPPLPMRFLGGAIEVLLWIDGKIAVLDVEKQRARAVLFDLPVPPNSVFECVPHIDNASTTVMLNS